jgi:spore coat polysaccharide biosynthesis protein SpsF (cytidylyltransferase family)
MGLRIVAIIQARLGSTRLPGKTLAEIAGRPMLAHVASRTQEIPGVTEAVIATSTNPIDDGIEAFARSARIPCVRGSEEDVLDRFRQAAVERKAEVVVRVTADCPLLDPEVAGLVVQKYCDRQMEIDYVSNVEPPTYPDGLDTEVFSPAALERAWREARDGADREHVTSYIRRQRERFRLDNVRNSRDLSEHRWTVDTEADLTFVRAVFDALGTHCHGSIHMNDVLLLLDERPELRRINAGQRRNEGFERSLAADTARRKGA